MVYLHTSALERLQSLQLLLARTQALDPSSFLGGSFQPTLL